MHRVERILGWIAFGMAAIAGLALALIAGIIIAEVTFRALRRPLVGATEIVRITFVVSVFFAFAYLVTQGREIRVDILQNMVSARYQRVLDALACLVTACFFGFLLWFSAVRLHNNWVRGVYMDGRLLIPMWIPWLTITVGSMMAVIAGILSAIRHLASARDAER